MAQAKTIYFKPDDIFVIYRLPNEDETVLIRQLNNQPYDFNADKINKKGFVFHPFNNENHPAIFINADKINKNYNFKFDISEVNNEIDNTKSDYMTKADSFISATKDTFRKIILSRTKTVQNKNIPIDEIFYSLCTNYKNAMVFLINHPKVGTWIGATPEMLLTLNNTKARTIALAGTQYTKTIDNIKWKSKEQEEQKAVMDFIEEILNKNKIKFDSKGPFTKIAAKNNNGVLTHIATEYAFELDNNIFSLIKQLHPTPAVSGFPKQKAIDYINKSEGYDREYYTGFLGPININTNKSLQLFVNLRIMKVFKNKFKLYIGGGLNSNSVAEDEWQETENKAKTLEEIIIKVSLKT